MRQVPARKGVYTGADRPCDSAESVTVAGRSLEGVVGKFANGIYQSDDSTTSWVKFKNPTYSQAEGLVLSTSFVIVMS